MKKILFFILLCLICIPSFAKDAKVMSWQDCVHEALRNNPGLAASRENINQSKAQKWISKSPMFPQITANSSANKSDNFSNSKNRNRYDYSLQGEQLLFDGFKTYNDVRSAKENITAAHFNNAVVSADVRYDLRGAFISLLRAQALVPITGSIVQRRKQNLDMIRLSYESGREHQGALLLAEADLRQAQFDLKKAKGDIMVAQYALAKAMGWENSASIRVKGEFKLSNSTKSENDFQFIAENHPQVKMKTAESESAKYGVESAKAEFFPELSLNAKVGKEAVGISSNDKGWSVGVGASLPIFEGGRRIANTQSAKAKFREALFNEKSERDNVLSTLAQTREDLDDAIELVQVQKKYLEAASVRAKIARAQYENGLLIFDNWVIIEDKFITTQKTYLDAQANMLLAEASWIRAKGGVLQ